MGAGYSSYNTQRSRPQSFGEKYFVGIECLGEKHFVGVEGWIPC